MELERQLADVRSDMKVKSCELNTLQACRDRKIDEAKQARDQDMLFLLLAEEKELKRMSDKRLARAIEKKASNSIHSSLQLRLAGSVDSPRNVKASKQKKENLDSETSNPTIDQHCEGVEHYQAIITDTSETSNPTTDQDREGEEHSQAVPDVESRHVKTRVNNRVTFSDKRDNEIHSESPVECNPRPNVESPHGVTRVNNNVEDALDKQRVITNVEDAHDEQRVITNVESRHDKTRVNNNLDSRRLKSVKRSSEHACLSLAKSSSLSSSALQLGVASVNQISKANPDKTSQASLSVALAECRKKFPKSSSSYKNVNDDADVVNDKDKMVAVKAVVAVQLVVELTPIFIPEGAQAEKKQLSSIHSTPTYDDNVVSDKAGFHSMPTYDDNFVNDEVSLILN